MRKENRMSSSSTREIEIQLSTRESINNTPDLTNPPPPQGEIRGRPAVLLTIRGVDVFKATFGAGPHKGNLDSPNTLRATFIIGVIGVAILAISIIAIVATQTNFASDIVEVIEEAADVLKFSASPIGGPGATLSLFIGTIGIGFAGGGFGIFYVGIRMEQKRLARPDLPSQTENSGSSSSEVERPQFQIVSNETSRGRIQENLTNLTANNRQTNAPFHFYSRPIFLSTEQIDTVPQNLQIAEENEMQPLELNQLISQTETTTTYELQNPGAEAGAYLIGFVRTDSLDIDTSCTFCIYQISEGTVVRHVEIASSFHLETTNTTLVQGSGQEKAILKLTRVAPVDVEE